MTELRADPSVPHRWTRTMRVLDRLSAALAAVPLAVLAGTLTLVLALVGSIAPAGDINDIWRFARAPTDPPDLGVAEPLLYSPVGPTLAHLVGADASTASVAYLHLALAIAFVAAIVMVVERRFGPLASRVVVVLLFAAPTAHLLLVWLGKPDPFTLVAGTTLVLARSRATIALGALLLGFNHFEQGAVVVATLVVLGGLGTLTGRVPPLAAAATGIAALVGGRILLAVHHSVFEIDPSLDRAGFVRANESLTIGRGLVDAPLMVLAGFACALPLVVIAARVLVQHHVVGWTRLTLATGLAVAAMLLTADETRVFAFVTWPALLWLTLRAWSAEPRVVARAAVAALILAVLVPVRVEYRFGDPSLEPAVDAPGPELRSGAGSTGDAPGARSVLGAPATMGRGHATPGGDRP